MGYLLNEEDDDATKVRRYLMDKNPDLFQPVSAPAPKSDLAQFQEDFSDDKYNQAKAQAEGRKSGLGWAQFAAGLGDAIAGHDSSQTAKDFQQIRQGINDSTIGDFDKRKAAAVKDIGLKKTMSQADPNSEASMAFRKAIEANFPAISKQYGDHWQNVTADDQESIFKPLQLKETIEARKEQARILAADRAENRAARADAQNETRNSKAAEKAKLSEKQIDAFTDLDNAESDLNNMLSSLGDHSGWTGSMDGRIPDMLVGSDQVAFRSAVGKYKDAYRKAITGAGAGPREIAILEQRLPSENDTFADFKAKAEEGRKEVKRRRDVMSSNLQKAGKNVEAFTQAPVPDSGKKNIVKTQTNTRTGEKRIVYDDGSVEVIPQVAGGR